MGTVLLLLLLDTNDDDDGGGGGDHPGDSDRASERVQVSQQLPVAYRQSASFDSRGIKKKKVGCELIFHRQRPLWRAVVHCVCLLESS